MGCKRPLLLILVLAAVAAAAYLSVARLDPLALLDQWRTPTTPVSASQNRALWADANRALTGFIGAGLKSGLGGPAAAASFGPGGEAARSAAEFSAAVAKLKAAEPPGEQKPLHRALLPIYLRMDEQMGLIRSAASAKNETRAAMEWEQLALLVEEAGAVTQLLSPGARWVVVTNTGGEGVYLRRTPHLEDRLTAWPEGARLMIVGPDVESDGRKWKNVQDPLGQTGWVPADYVSQ